MIYLAAAINNLIIPYRIAFAQMFAHIHDEHEAEVYNDGGTESYEGGIDEEQANASGCYTEFFAQVCAHAEGIIFEKMLDSIRQVIHSNSFIYFQLAKKLIYRAKIRLTNITYQPLKNGGGDLIFLSIIAKKFT